MNGVPRRNTDASGEPFRDGRAPVNRSQKRYSIIACRTAFSKSYCAGP